MEMLTRRSFPSSPHVAQGNSPSAHDLEEIHMFEPSDEELEDLDSDGVETLVMEMAALEALFDAIRDEGPAARGVSLARQALEAQTREPSTFEQHIVRAALSKATGLDLPQAVPTPTAGPSWTTFVYETIAAAWLRWFNTGDASAVGLMARIRTLEPDMGHVPDGAIELMSLGEWGRAVEALAIGDEANARRHFERAVEIGSQMGSDSNPSVNWTYAASFFRA